MLLWTAAPGVYGAMLPLLGKSAQVELQGYGSQVYARAETGHPGTHEADVPLAVAGLGPDPFALVDRLMRRAAGILGTCRLREEKAVPAWTRHLGWCSWNAFGVRVTERDVLAAAESFRAAAFPLGFMILDDGWQDADGARRLRSFRAGPGFPRGLRPVIDEARRLAGLQAFGVWHAFLGYWNGVDPVSELGQRYQVLENGLVHPDDAPRFYDDLCATLKEDGADFTKADNQAATARFLRDHYALVSGLQLLRTAFESAEARVFGGAALNCMAQETAALYQLTSTVVMRNSDDYYPDRPTNPEEHVLQNAYNALWTRTIAIPDWDMFQSHHPAAWWHAAARAVSGGPVYVTDTPGQQQWDVLRALVLPDGRIPPLDGFAVPTRKCLFADPRCDGPLVVWNRSGESTLFGVFNLGDAPAAAALGPPDAELPAVSGGERYVLWSRNHGLLGVLGSDARATGPIPPKGWDVLVLAPVHRAVAVIGNPDALNPSGWVAATGWTDAPGGPVLEVSLRARGPLLVASLQRPGSVTCDGVPAPAVFDGRQLRIDLAPGPGPARVRLAF